MEGVHSNIQKDKLLLLIPDACPFEDAPNGEYRTILGKCYYFQKSALNFVDAAVNCESKFNGNGRLFEPKTKKSNNVVVNVAHHSALREF